MSVAADRLEFAPPMTGGLSRSLVLAVFAHLLLVGALTLGVQWRRDAPTIEVQAELWSAVPQAVAPRLVEPPPPPPPRQPAPVVVAPPPPAPSMDAQIALERDRQQQLKQERQLAAQQRERDRLALQRREQEKVALEKRREQEQRDKERLSAEKRREQEKLAAEKKRALDKLAAEKKRAQEKLTAEKKREQERLQAVREREEAAGLDAQRQVNLQRMAGLAGASGAPGATGTAQKASGGSSSYGGRVSASVKPNIVFTENPPDNPTALVEVRAAPDGTITGRKLVKSSGNKAWDEAVLKAIDKTAVLPRDIDGTVPAVLEINFRRRD